MLTYNLGLVAQPATDHLAEMFFIDVAGIHVYYFRPQAIDQRREHGRLEFVQGHPRSSGVYLIVGHDLKFDFARFIDHYCQFFPTGWCQFLRIAYLHLP